MNEEIIEQIAQKNGAGEEQVVEKHMVTWLFFSITGKKYAVRSNAVLEIIRDVSVYKLPFMPDYIEGVLNRRGDPFTVINPRCLLNVDDKKAPDEPLFLILKRTDDQLSIHISDILFFAELEEKELNLIPENDEEGFFLGILSYNGEEVPVLNPDAFELLIRKDLGSS